MPEPQPQSPEWWIARLYRALQTQRAEADFFNDYYTGNHPLPWLAPQAREEFRRLVRMTRSNYMGLVCDATAERASVEGFRFGSDGVADEDTWAIWQGNNLDSYSDLAWLEALIGGVSFFLVAPNPDAPSLPRVWVEHASQAVVEHVPGSNRNETAAGLKVWDDDWTGELHANLYLPGFIYKFRAPRQQVVQGDRSTSLTVGAPRWVERDVAGEAPNGQRRNPLGVVPLVEIPNNPRLMTGGVSELYDVTDIQDRINKTLFDRMQTQEFGVDPQKWAKAFPSVDADGNPQTVEFGRNRMVTTDVAETGFGNFAVAPLSPYLEAKREDVKDIASRTRTPAQYLLGEMVNVNGEALALDTPIPTPRGLVPIGDLHDGDEVFDERGTRQVVEHAHPVLLDRPCYKVTFDDDATFVADAGHRWTVTSVPLAARNRGAKTRTGRTERAVLTTKDIASTMRSANGHLVHAVEVADPVDGPELELAVDPYVLGVYLGDGCRHNATIACGDEDLDEMVALLTDAGERVTVRKTRTVNLVTCHKVGPRPALRGRINGLGVLFEKSIPEDYFQGSYKQRLALLQGVMDTDGTAQRRQPGAVALDLHDERLARDVHRLACSLGHKVALRSSPYAKDGEVFIRWRMRWNPSDTVFRLGRKAAIQEGRGMARPKTVRRVIVSVEPVPSVPVRCLTVTGPSHLFLAGVEHVPTHNTLKASESGLVSKVKQRRRPWSEAAETAMRLARRVAGLSDPGEARMETIWTNPQYRTEGELTDAVIKRVQAGISSLRQAREDVGYTATQIRQLESDDEAASLDPVTRAVVNGLGDGNTAAVSA